MYKQDKVLEKLYKKAIGYDIEEIVEEYGGDERGGELIKRKVTKKPVPPDVTALKTYLELTENKDEFESMSDQELLKEKEKLINEFKKSNAVKKPKPNSKSKQNEV